MSRAHDAARRHHMQSPELYFCLFAFPTDGHGGSHRVGAETGEFHPASNPENALEVLRQIPRPLAVAAPGIDRARCAVRPAPNDQLVPVPAAMWTGGAFQFATDRPDASRLFLRAV